MYTGSVFLKDILLDILKLKRTSYDYEKLGIDCDRNIFYYAIKRKNKYLNDNIILALKTLIIKKVNTKKKKDELYQYLNKYLTNDVKTLIKNSPEDFEHILDVALSKFSYKNTNIKELKKSREKEIVEFYLKALSFLHTDFEIAKIVIQKMIDFIIKDISENADVEISNKTKTYTNLLYKQVIPQRILSCITYLNRLLGLKDCSIDGIDMIFSNLKYIIKWYYEEFLGKSFNELEIKANSRYYKKEEDSIRIVSLEDLIKEGWTLEKFAKEMLGLFYKTIDNLAEDNTSTIQEMIDIINIQPETRRIVINEKNEAIGCWTLNPMFPEDFKRNKDGLFYVSEFNADTIPIIMKNNTYNIHFGAICLLEGYRKTAIFNKLLFSIISYIEELAINNIFIDEICTQAYTGNGLALAKSIGLSYMCEHKDGKGKVYCGKLTDLLEKPFLRDFSLLKSIYNEKRD